MANDGVKNEVKVAFPPDFVFKENKQRMVPSASVIAKSVVMYQFERMEYPEEGGQLAWFKDCPYPAKGHPFPQAIHAINGVKRYLREILRVLVHKDMALPILGFIFSGRKKRLAILTRFLQAFTEASRMMIAPYILVEKRYSPCPRELRKLIVIFLREIGVDAITADGFAEVFVSLIEYDNAYRYRLEDILSETTQEKILQNPVEEMKKLVHIMLEREPNSGMSGNVGKFNNFFKIIRILLFIPSYKKAFIKALQSIDFSKLQLDEADRYHCMLWSDYNFFGLPIETRIEMYKKFHEEHPPFPERITINPE